MKILYLTPGCFDKGGISRYCRYQISALREIYGEESVRVISLLGPKENDFEDFFGVYWHGSGASLSSKLAFTLKTLKESLFWQPDIIHSAHINFSGLMQLSSFFNGAKTLLNTYGLEVWSGLSWDALWGVKQCDLVMSDCHATADYIESQSWRKNQKVPVIWDCVDLSRFTPGDCPLDVKRRYNIPNDKLVVMTLGRLAREASHKGYDRLLESFAKVAKKTNNVVLVFAGRGNLIEPLKIKAEEFGISSQVIFTGSVEEKDLPDIYRASSIFSLVSDRGNGRGEGIPLTPLEAMACGKPIIVGNQDGSREAVVDEKNGYAIDPFNLDLHAKLMLSLIENSSLRNEMARHAVDVAQSHFSYDEFKSKHEKIFKNQIHKPK